MMRIRGKYPFWGNRYVGDFIMVIKWNASFRWSVRPNYAWGTIETTNIGKTHSLDKRYWPLFSSCWWLFKWRESVTNISKMSTVNCLQNPSSSKSYSFVGSKSGLKNGALETIISLLLWPIELKMRFFRSQRLWVTRLSWVSSIIDLMYERLNP